MPKTTREQLGIDEDFVFENDEIDNPESDTGKLVQHLVDSRAKKIVGETLQQERQRIANAQREQVLKMNVHRL